jgi:hypothetical protein
MEEQLSFDVPGDPPARPEFLTIAEAAQRVRCCESGSELSVRFSGGWTYTFLHGPLLTTVAIPPLEVEASSRRDLAAQNLDLFGDRCRCELGDDRVDGHGAARLGDRDAVMAITDRVRITDPDQ